MRGILEKDAAFVERFLDQMVLRTVKLLDRRFKVAHTTMNQLGTPAAGAFGQVRLVNQRDLQTTARRINRDTAPRRSTTNNQ